MVRLGFPMEHSFPTSLRHSHAAPTWYDLACPNDRIEDLMKFHLLALLLFAFTPHAFGDTVVTPEPGTMAMLGIGVAVLGFAAWRANRKK